MPKQQTIQKKAVGYFSHPNKIDLPPGAVVKCENAVVVRDGVYQKRRGFGRYNAAALSGTVSGVLYDFGGVLMLRDGAAGGSLKYDNGSGVFTAVPSSPAFSDPDGVTRSQSVEAAKNLLFTDTSGVWVSDLFSSTPKRAGVPKGLDVNPALTGTGGSWFSPGTQVGYRVTFVRIDANMNTKIGSPSYAINILSPLTAVTITVAGVTASVVHTAHGYTTGDVVVIRDADKPEYNAAGATITVTGANGYDYTVPAGSAASGTANAGKAFNIALDITIPDEMAAGDFYEIYRTELSGSPSDPPVFRFFKVIRNKLTAGDITAGTVSYTDTLDPSLLGSDLYTNDTEETESLANDRPPFCLSIATFKTHTFYGQTTDKMRLDLQLLDVIGLTDDVSLITITSPTFPAGRTYTFSTAENVGARKFRRFTTAVAETPTIAQAIASTMRSLCRVINRDVGQVDLLAYYTSGEDDAPGQILLESLLPNTAAFTLTADSAGTGGKFTPTLPTSGITVTSTAINEQNGLRRSKSSQPEAVPEGSKYLVGKANKKILAIKSLTDSLLIFKEDGIFQLTGETDGKGGSIFIVTEKDPTIIIKGPNTAVTLDNAVYLFSNNGVVRVSSSGSGLISRAIEEELLRAATSTAWSANAFAFSYESERLYCLCAPEKSTDTSNMVIWVYNYFTNSWSVWRKRIQAGLVLSRDDKIYSMHAVDPYVLQERKIRNTQFKDIVDEDIATTISNLSTTVDEFGVTVTTCTVTWSYTTVPLKEGYLLTQGSLWGKIRSVQPISGFPTSFNIQLDRSKAFTAAAATISIGIDSIIDWLDSAGNPGTQKFYSKVQFYQEADYAIFCEVGFFADNQAGFEVVKIRTNPRGRGWGSSPWGSSAWGDGQEGRSTPISVPTPVDHARCAALRIRFRNRYSYEQIALYQIALSVRPYSDRTTRKPN